MESIEQRRMLQQGALDAGARAEGLDQGRIHLDPMAPPPEQPDVGPEGGP